jgi:hypothetical protein
MMNSASRHNRISLIVMIFGGLLAVALVFGPLGPTLRYLDDFFAERPQSMQVPDLSFSRRCCLSGCSCSPYRSSFSFELGEGQRSKPMRSFAS